MTDELLPYYQRELAYVRKLGAEFAQQHPKIAGRLRMRAEETQDPHVERMIEAFAYLTSRIRYKLDDDYPEIAHSLLEVLYPHYLAPIPSMAVVRFELDRAQAELTSGVPIAKGSTVEAAAPGGEVCRFRTCYPTRLWPFDVVSADLAGPPFPGPKTAFSAKARSVLRLTLRGYSADVPFGQMEIDNFRFFLQGQPQHVYPLYELVLNNVLGIAVSSPDASEEHPPAILSRGNIRPVGFAADEGMLPYPSRSFLGYRLLTEYFAFPQKFLFFDLFWDQVTAGQRAELGNTVEFFFYFDRSVPEIEHGVSRETFVTGCTPIVNLFPQRAEPIRLTHSESEYRVVPDSRRPLATEVYSINRVVATSPRNKTVEYRPFFSFKHAAQASEQTTFWHPVRRPRSPHRTVADPGTEVHLSFVDLAFDPSVEDGWIVDVETTCLNRDLPERLPFGGGEPRMQLTGGEPVSLVECLTAPTRTYRPALRHGVVWRLISHLSTNHLSLCDYEDGADGLREILRLYDFADSEETRAMIDGIRSVTTRRVVGRSGGGVAGGLCRGLEVTVDFDEDRFIGSGVYLFASVLERFLGLYCSINSFTRMIAKTAKREGVLGKWPPRAGEQVLL